MAEELGLAHLADLSMLLRFYDAIATSVGAEGDHVRRCDTQRTRDGSPFRLTAEAEGVPPTVDYRAVLVASHGLVSGGPGGLPIEINELNPGLYG